MKIFTVFLLLVSTLQSYCQRVEFAKNKDWGFDDYYTRSYPNFLDTGVVVIYSSTKDGIRWRYRGGYSTLYQTGLMHLDSNGDSISIHPDLTKYGYSFGLTKSLNGYVTTFEETPLDSIGDTRNRLNIYDQFLNIRYSPVLGSEYPRSKYFALNDVYASETSDKIFAIGSVLDSVFGSDIVLYKVNAIGTQEWSKQYTFFGNQNGLLISADLGESKMLISGLSRGGAAYVMGIDTSSTIQYQRELFVPRTRASRVNIKRTPDGGFAGILVGDSAVFFKYDSQFRLLYKEDFLYSLYSSLNVFADGNVALQFTKDRSSVDSLVKFNPDNGNRIWGAVMYEPGFAQNDAAGFSYFPSGNVLITGYKLGFSHGFSDFYWAKISNFGHPFDPVTATMPRAQQKPAWLGLLPNPARDVVSISCSAPPRRSYIYSSTGRLVHQFTGFKANISSLPAGIYLVQTELQNGQRATAKLVKE